MGKVTATQSTAKKRRSVLALNSAPYGSTEPPAPFIGCFFFVLKSPYFTVHFRIKVLIDIGKEKNKTLRFGR